MTVPKTENYCSRSGGVTGKGSGEMVVLDGARHLRNSGAEDVLKWTDEDWDVHRARR